MLNMHDHYIVPIIELGERLKDHFGLTIREHPHFDPVDPIHAPNSYHYYGEAIDVQDWRDDVLNGVHWKERTQNLKDFLTGIGPEVFGPGDPGHDTHVHLAAENGLFHMDPCQFHVIFCNDEDGKSFTFSQQDRWKSFEKMARQIESNLLHSCDYN